MTSPLSPNRAQQEYSFSIEGQNIPIEEFNRILDELSKCNAEIQEAAKATRDAVVDTFKLMAEKDLKTNETLANLQETVQDANEILKQTGEIREATSASIHRIEESNNRREKIERDIVAISNELSAYHEAMLGPFVAIGERLAAISGTVPAPWRWVRTQYQSITANEAPRPAVGSPPARTLMATLLFAAGAVVAGGSSIFLYEKVRCMDSYFLGCAPKIMG